MAGGAKKGPEKASLLARATTAAAGVAATPVRGVANTVDAGVATAPPGVAGGDSILLADGDAGVCRAGDAMLLGVVLLCSLCRKPAR